MSFYLDLFHCNWQELIQILFGRDFTLIPGLERTNGLMYILQWREFQREDRVGESVTSRDIYKIHLTATKLPSVKKQAAPWMKVQHSCILKEFYCCFPSFMCRTVCFVKLFTGYWFPIFKLDLEELLVRVASCRFAFQVALSCKSPTFNHYGHCCLQRPWYQDTNSASIIRTLWLLLYLLKKCILLKVSLVLDGVVTTCKMKRGPL